MIKRLPVVQPKASEDEAAEQRSRPAWVTVGVVLAAVFWVPSLLVALWVRARLFATFVGDREPSAVSEGTLAALGVAGALLVVLSLAVACVAATAIVGRFGLRTFPRDGSFVGGLVAVGAVALAEVGGTGLGLGAALAVHGTLLVVGALAGRAGHRLGARARSGSGP